MHLAFKIDERQGRGTEQNGPNSWIVKEFPFLDTDEHKIFKSMNNNYLCISAKICALFNFRYVVMIKKLK
jgi:hypothetical protein